MQIKFIGKAKLTKQGQLTLPYEARNDLGIDADKELYWYRADDLLIVVKDLVNQKEIEDLIIKKGRKLKKR